MNELQRRAYRSVFTKEVNAIEVLLNQNEDLENIIARFNVLNANFEKLCSLNDSVMLNLLNKEGVTEDDIESEITGANEYNNRYHQISVKFNKLQLVGNSDRESNQTISNKLHLPKIELKKFDGELKNWIGFWSQFSKIHEDNSLGDQDKFEYLVQSMKPGSPAQKLIEGFPPSKENYSKAVELLKSRYGKDELLIEYYVRELLTLVLSKSRYLSVTCLYDKLEVQLRALESLGVTKEKYVAMLFPLVETAIPDHIFKVWERYRVNRNTSTKEPDNCLRELLQFLKTEVEAEERLRLRENCFGVKSNEKTSTSLDPLRSQRFGKSKTNTPSAAVLVSSESTKMCTDINTNLNRSPCIFCGKSSHNSPDCFSIFDKTVTERTELVKKKGACLKCLKKGHLAQKCKTQVKCHICMDRHLAILCPKVCKDNVSSGGEDKTEPSIQNTSSFSSVDNKSKTTYLQTLTTFINCHGKLKKVRILCDSGSQKSFISSNCVTKLGLKSNDKVLIQQEVFGGKQTGPKYHRTYKITLRSLNSDFETTVKAIEQQVICNQVPKFCDHNLIKHLEQENIILTDVSSSCEEDSTSIDVLLGADAWTQIITSEFYKVNDQLVAVRTQLGWTIVGDSDGDSSVVSSMFLALQSPQDVKQFWELETLGIMDPCVKLEKEERDKKVVRFFEETVTRDSTGRYVVQLPWVEGHPLPESNRHVAEKRLHTTTRKLQNMNLYDDYDATFKEWLQKKIIEKVEEPDVTLGENSGLVHYLPHRAVVKEGSTTRIRPVFDASCKDKNGFSLNDCLEVGPNLIELVPKVLTNLRKYKFGLTSDIEKAFLQISISLKDRDMLRFLWWEEGRIVVYRHTRVVFGLTCSPFLLGAVINNLLSNAPDCYKSVADKLQESFYVDNCLTGVDSESEKHVLIKQAQELLCLGEFNLRGWAGNFEQTIQNVLGLKWDCSSDTLFCNVTVSHLRSDEELTRRSLLSNTQRIYDPIGFTAPVTLIPKVILQKTWSLKIGWDDKLPENLQIEYKKWSEQIGIIEECRIQRQVVVNNSSTLHIFCDASRTAYGACVFLRTEVVGTVRISLVIAKSRVSPIKPITLPRLELMAALIGVRLSILARQCLDKPDIPCFYWTDSSVTLAWISNQGKWSVFVNNRVKEINEFSNPLQWRYVSGQTNPADLISRGCLPQQLLKSQWWNGPMWLYENEWPNENPTPDRQIVESENKKVVITSSTLEVFSIPNILGERFSKYSSIVRTIVWMIRFKNKNTKNSDISSEEFQFAEKVLIKLVQKDSFNRERNHPNLSGIKTIVDEDGIIRLNTRLLNQEYSREYTQPIVLPSNHIITERIIQQEHLVHKHAGTQTLLVILRERFWILKGRKTVGRVTHQCIPCKKLSAKPCQAPEGPLPEDRTNLSSCFQVTGIDLAGPLITKEKKKCWVVIFTCAVYRAVHFELIPSLSTDAFILALRRFISRRGRVNVIYSDNGTNFVGLYNQLKNLNWNKIQNESSLKKIVWRFNPPAAPWWGGFWERLVRILKELLRRNLGNASLNHEELNTLICECEGIMNNRPLTYVSENIEDLKPITPSMFIQSLQGNEVTDLDMLEQINLNSRWRYVLKIREGLKTRFQKEYLGFLKSLKRNDKDKYEIKVGDIVLIHAENKKRIFWPLGKIIEIYPSKDKIPRLVKVKTQTGTLLRPIQRVYPLEVETNDAKNEVLREVLSLKGRKIKKPNRLDL